MKKFLILGLLVVLAGCNDKVPVGAMVQGNELCQRYGGIHSITTTDVFHKFWATCQQGQTILFKFGENNGQVVHQNL